MKKEQSFPRQRRLVTKAEFKSIFDKSKKISQRYLVILYKPNQSGHARLGVIVAKRSVNSAVERHRIKRIARESFRHSQEQLKGIDIIIIARGQCDQLSNQKLREGIDSLWVKLKS